MEDLLTLVQKLGIFIVLAQTILHFRANDSYEKYIRILTNIMILSLIIVPILAIFQKDIPREMRIRIQKYQQRILETESRMEEATENSETELLLADQITRQMQEEIKYKLNNLKGDDIQNAYKVEQVKIMGLSETEQFDDNQLKIVITVTKKVENDNMKTHIKEKEGKIPEKENKKVERVKIEAITVGSEKAMKTEADAFRMLRAAYAKQLGVDETCVEVR